MSTIVGIDLGTTNSAIAVLDDTGRPRIVENAEGANITPSAVFYEQDNATVIVGQAAKDNAEIHKERVFQAFKRAMDREGPFTRSEPPFAVQATPIELSALVLRKLVQDAATRVGPIDSAVITVPANFADEARRATLAAGEQAGLSVKHIVNEPTAALFYYAFERPVGGTVLVYDFGGGTLDITIATVQGRNVDIITSKGDPTLGGVDCDCRLAEIIAKRYTDQTGERFDSPTVHALGKTVEDYKKQLSTRETISVQVTGGGSGRQIFEVTRSEFEAATATLITRADMLVESALSDANLKASDVGDIFLVGGSTRMPMVTAHLKSLFGKDPICSINPDEVVALGAALYAGVTADPSKLNAAQVSSVQSMKLREVANHHYGMVSIDSEAAGGPRLKVSIVIEKNTPIPAAKTESFYTVNAGQTEVECIVTQSATRESDPDFVRKIWEGELGPLPPGRPMEQQVDVTFTYDANQVMQCAFVDVASGIRKDISLGLTESASTGPKRDLDKFQVS